MPTYDYVCDACGHEFEHRQSMTSARLRTCPSCKRRRLRRLIGSGAGVIFKGSGFYETDYKAKKGPKNKPQESDSSSAESSSAKEATSDTSKDSAKPEKDSAKKKAKKDD